GRKIKSAKEYKLLFLKKEMSEIDILCPNDRCYLRELGFIKFEIKNGKAVFKEASFYPPFVTWNSSQLGREEAHRILKGHLKEIVTKIIDWDNITEEIKGIKMEKTT
ncbi:MAG TPA: hypothetical protein ENF41_02845, partial [Candidatus Bathyarchaeota archaeon]|nr:hypothetical protein [Candidatus Bathyarchaeota archaeon]